MTKISAWVGCVVLALLSAVVMSTASSADDYVPSPVPSTSVVVQSTTSSTSSTTAGECSSALRTSGPALAGGGTTCASGVTTTAPTQVAVQGTSRSSDLASTGVGSNVAVLAVVGIGVLLIGGVLTFFGARMMRRPKLH